MNLQTAWLLLAWQALAVFAPLLVCIMFARTLLPGRTPLITAIADAAQGPLDAPMRRYTRQLTAFWAMVCALLFLLNLALFRERLELPWWLPGSTVPLLVGGLFVAEYLYRKRRFPEHDHPGFADYLRIISAHRWRL